MQEIAEQFKEELQELLNRYKDHLTTPQIMRIAQPIFAKTIGFRDNPERFKGLKGFGYAKGFPIIDELDHCSAQKFIDVNGLKVPAELMEKPDPEFRKMMQGDLQCSAQMIAEADCDGDFRKCDSACFKGYNKPCSKGEFKCTD